MSEPVFSRILLKLSGEVLANKHGFGIDPEKVLYLAREIEPIYKDLKGWKQDLTQLSSYDDVSNNLKEFVQFLEQELQVPIKIVSVGPDRTQTLIR